VGGESDADTRYIAPTVLTGITKDDPVMAEEIFGPILPVVTARSVEEAMDFINARARPLAAYYFDDDAARAQRFVRGTCSGGVTVNDTVLHFGINALPFGGIGPSGMGAYHGRAGFDAMSKALPVLWQPRRAGSDLLKPPYSRVTKFIDFIIR